jgi:CubicO group peptidase (beta-lactamase class C family)
MDSVVGKYHEVSLTKSESLAMLTKLLLLHSLLFSIARGSCQSDGPSPETPPNPMPAKVDALFAEWAKPDSPGCAVAVVRGGKILYAKGYGMADLEHDIPITPQSVFYIGSVGKQFTAYAVVRLAGQGKLSLDDDIHKYLPELHDFGRPVTIRHLIHHTSGLRDYFELLTLAGTREGDLVTQKDLLRIIWKQRELNFPTGQRHLYSNSNYALLATIVERVTGESYRAWMARNVFEPLGMSQTQVGDDHARIIKNRAWSYRSDPVAKGAFKTMVFPYSGYGAGGIYSTVEDLARWLSNFTKPREGDAPVTRQMFEPGRLTSGQQIGYAFALMVDEHRGMKRIGHAGALAGYRAYLGFFPDQDLGVIILSNLASFPPGKAMQLADLFLPEKIEKPKTATPGSAAEPTRAAVAIPLTRTEGPGEKPTEKPPALTADELGAYSGSYSSPELEATCTIAVEHESLVARLARNNEIRLAARDKDHFTGSGAVRDVQFERDAQGRISGLRVSGGRVVGVLFQKQP